MAGIPKLWLYKASNAPIVAILRRDENRDWLLIKWELETDTFTEGQWLRKKKINPHYCSISPNGKYFGYSYTDYHDLEAHIIISKIPYFTAEYYSNSAWGSYVYFTKTGEFMSNIQLEKRGDEEITQIPLNQDLIHESYVIIDKQYKKEAESHMYNVKYDFTYNKKKITVEDENIKVEDEIKYETTGKKFRYVKKGEL